MTNTGWLIPLGGIGRRAEFDATSSHARLRFMYEEIGCSTVDMVALTPTVDVWVDDEGMYNSQPNIVGATVVENLVRTTGRTLRQPLFGTLLFLSRDGEDATGLSDDDLEILEGLTRTAYDEVLLDVLRIRARKP